MHYRSRLKAALLVIWFIGIGSPAFAVEIILDDFQAKWSDRWWSTGSISGLGVQQEGGVVHLDFPASKGQWISFQAKGEWLIDALRQMRLTAESELTITAGMRGSGRLNAKLLTDRGHFSTSIPLPSNGVMERIVMPIASIMPPDQTAGASLQVICLNAVDSDAFGVDVKEISLSGLEYVGEDVLKDADHVELTIDRFADSDLLPINQPAPHWIFRRCGDGMRLFGRIVQDADGRYLRYEAEGESWCRFGRTIDLAGGAAVVVEVRSDRVRPVGCQLWTKYASEDIGGWPTDRVYHTTLWLSPRWERAVLLFDRFTQTRGEAEPIDTAKISALVLSDGPGVVEIRRVGVITSVADAVRRRKQMLLEEIDNRQFDAAILDVRGFDVAELGEGLRSLSAEVGSLAADADGLERSYALEPRFAGIAGLIDDLRRVNRLDRRVAAAGDWLALLVNPQYEKRHDELREDLASLKWRFDPQAYDDLDRRTAALWREVWHDVCERGVSWRVEDGRILREDGWAINLYGTNDVGAESRSTYDDYARMAELGLNAVRFVITHMRLEPSPGEYDMALLERVRQGIEWAAEFGIYGVIDLHFPHPDWAVKGGKGYESPTGKPYSGLYHHVEHLRRTHELMMREVGMLPNVIAQEVPSNEPSLRGVYKGHQAKDLLDRTIVTLPWQMENWNQFLKRRYGSIEALREAWRPDFDDPIEKGLGPDEHWDTNSILPPGGREEDKQVCTRIYDYLLWAVDLHTGTCQKLAEAIKAIRPGILVFQQQCLGGSDWSGDPIPLEFDTLQQIAGPDIDGLAAHYNRAWAPLMLPATKLYWYNGELPQAHWLSSWLEAHARAGGILYWAYSSSPDPRENLRCLQPDGRLKRDRRFVPLMADFYKTCFSSEPRERSIAIVCNSRLSATNGQRFGGLGRMLTNLGLRFDLIGSMYLDAKPDVLADYQAVFFTLDYLAPKALEIILNSGKPAFLYGCLDRDLNARSVVDDLGPAAEKLALSVKPVDVLGGGIQGSLDLQGDWRLSLDPNEVGLNEGRHLPDYDDSQWQVQTVPGAWENIGQWEAARAYDGVAWYRRTVEVPKEWAGKNVSLEIGAIDDFDETYFNGQPIGRTDRETPNWWTARRSYPIRPELIRTDAPNVIAVRVIDIMNAGGIVLGPVRLICTDRQTVTISEDWGRLTAGRRKLVTPRTRRASLEGGRTLARFDDGTSAILLAGRTLLYLASPEIDPADDFDRALVCSFLEAAGVPPAESPLRNGSLWVHEFDGWLSIENASGGPIPVDIATDAPRLRSLLGPQRTIEGSDNIFAVEVPAEGDILEKRK
ncbi:MAG: cellulase family glycosylhydrolase [Phycisphaerae bacterium]|nr:cellulase family glycosylhydrolase [Phycisphaerae bacterium]